MGFVSSPSWITALFEAQYLCFSVILINVISILVLHASLQGLCFWRFLASSVRMVFFGKLLCLYMFPRSNSVHTHTQIHCYLM